MKNFNIFFKKQFMRICYILRDRKTKSVFFSSFWGKYSDNPKAISECLHKLAPEIEQIWLLNRNNEKYAPDYVSVVYPGTLMAWKKLAQAKIWVFNDTYRQRSGIYKGDQTFYIQTWHGDRGVKRIGYLTEYSKKANYNGQDLSKCNLFVVGSEYGEKKARTGQKYEGEFSKVGMPRNDRLVNLRYYSEEVVGIKRSLGLDEHAKIMLYAPTYRDGAVQKQHCVIDINQSLRCLSSTGEKWICLLRAHSSSKGLISSGKEAIDVTSYPDMADLLLISDLLITDYSSCAGDFILTGKPVILAHFDKEEYQKDSRTLWVNPNEAGYLIANNQKELNDILSNLNSFNHNSISEKIKDFYGTNETGHASEYIAKRIIKEIN